MPIADLAFEHRMYLPLACVVILAVLAANWLCEQVAERQPNLAPFVRQAAPTVLLLIATALACRTYLRNQDYCDPIVFWQKVLAYNPAQGRACRMLASAYQQQGDVRAAQDLLADFVRRYPHDPLPWADYGNLCFQQADFRGAAEKYERAAQLFPERYVLHLNLSKARLILHEYPAATAACRLAVHHAPKNRNAVKQLAWLLATAPDDSLRNGAEALELIQSLPAQVIRDLQQIEVLAAAQAETGHFDAAVATAERLVRYAQRAKSKRQAEFAAQLAQYQKQQPWRLSAQDVVQSSQALPAKSVNEAPAVVVEGTAS